MKIKNITKPLAVAAVFSLSLIGFNVTHSKELIGNEEVSTTIASLGNQAQAYCNEATYQGELNDGICSGAANQPSTRCHAATTGTNCTTTKLY